MQTSTTTTPEPRTRFQQLDDLAQRYRELVAELRAIGADYWVDPYTVIYDIRHAVKILEARATGAFAIIDQIGGER